MPPSISAKTIQVPAVIRESDGAVMVWTSGGYKTADDAGIDIADPSKIQLDSLLAGERLDFDWQSFEAGATQGANVLPGRVDQVLGTIGATTDYLKRVNGVVSVPAHSRMVLKEGNPIPKKSLTTHAGTASTTTVLNTAINPDSVYVDQYRDHLVRVGAGPYRKILAHAAFGPGAVNSYTLDQPLDAVPAASTAIAIENPDLVVEILPVGAPVGTHSIMIERHCTGKGWRLSTGTGVSAVVSGDFDNV